MKRIISTIALSLCVMLTNAQGPVLIEDINPNNNSNNDPNGAFNGSNPINFLEFNNTLYFLASNQSPIQYDLYKKQGEDVVNVSEDLGGFPESISEMVVFNGYIYFSASGKLYKTIAVAQLGGGSVEEVPLQGVSVVDNLTVFNGKLYFSGFTSTKGTELYEVFTNDFVRLVSDLASGSDSFVPTNLIASATALYFRKNSGDRWWVYYGTGTPSVLPSAVYRDINDYLIFNDKLYFTAETDLSMGGFSQTANSLFETDGLSAPELIMDGNLFITNTNDLGIYKNQLVVDGEVLGFSFSEDFLGFYDGSSLNRITKTYNFGGDFTENNDTLYFGAQSGSNDYELWRYVDGGTPELVHNINPSGNSSPGEFYSFENNLYFSANDGNGGKELWAIGEDYVSNITTSTSKLDALSQVVNVYPNPATSFIFTPQEEIRVFNISGQLVLNTLSNGVMDISSLDHGFYLIQGETFSEKLVKK